MRKSIMLALAWQVFVTAIAGCAAYIAHEKYGFDAVQTASVMLLFFPLAIGMPMPTD